MDSNRCIDKEFRFIQDLNEVRHAIKESCGFCEIDTEELVELKILTERKMQEIDNLIIDAVKKNAEIIEKDSKIKKLEEKIELLSNANIY